MAAFERVSRYQVVPFGAESALDIRSAPLPRIPNPSDYDPREHREPKAPISSWMAHINLVRTMLGPGLLGAPCAVSSSGLFLGITFTLLSGFLLIHTYTMLLNNLAEVSRQLSIPRISYRYGFRAAVLHGPPIFNFLGTHGPTIIAFFMIMSQIGICTVCVIHTADNLRDIVDWSNTDPALLTLLPCYLLLEYFMRNLKRVSYFGLFGSVLNFMGLSLIVYHIFKDPQKDFAYIEYDIGGWMFTSGVCLFNLSALAVILSLDKALEHPKIMTDTYGVINLSLGIPTLLSAFVGASAYWSFGPMEENVLRALPYVDITAMMAMAFYVISVSFSYPLHFHPIIGVIEEMCMNGADDYVPSEATMDVIKLISRPIFIIFTFMLAYWFPYQGPFLAFVGNISTNMLSIVFPIVMDLSLRYGVPNSYGPYQIILIKDVLILILGVLVFMFGTYFCAYLIYIRRLAAASEKRRDFF